MLQKLWQQCCKYSVGLTNHHIYHPAIPLLWQRTVADSVGHIPFLLPDGVSETEYSFAGRDVCCFNADNSQNDGVIAFFHGGGFTTGSITSHRPMCRHLAKVSQMPIYSVDYRLAPEHPFPAALDDVEAVVLSLLQTLNIDAGKLILAGDSAGGNLALAAAKRLQIQQKQPAALILLSPWVEPMDTRLTWRFDPVINPLWGIMSAQAYRGEAEDRNPEFAPIYADLAGLPPILLQVGREEILLPQIERLANKLQEANVPLTFEIYDYLWHSGQMSASINPVATEAVKSCGEFVQNIRRNRQK
ncbi:alpha/beta hydrolase [Stenoxybacter acetivorans]|uniref:alpha/beta hydrolase n=1 Tax=Stenoxybacter acetivorans TaxID=422441 RepID=UPI00068D1CC4|nr:alpha/beta hydrolase [Stenoxybacter acetivorans]